MMEGREEGWEWDGTCDEMRRGGKDPHVCYTKTVVGGWTPTVSYKSQVRNVVMRETMNGILLSSGDGLWLTYRMEYTETDMR
jgi:hypothetical protein